MDIKKYILPSKTLTVLSYILFNYYLFFVGKLTSHKIFRSGRSTGIIDADAEIKKAHEEFMYYKTYIQREKFQGAKILEIGTGAYFLTALNFIGEGAQSVTTIDKFTCLRSKKEQKAVYESYLSKLPLEKQERIKKALFFKDESFLLNKERIRYSQIALEDFTSTYKYDYIVSYAVFEHLWDAKKSIQAMKRVLKPEGKIIAFVGNNDHGMFSLYHDWYQFYTIPKWLYSLMASKNGGCPNRLTPLQFKKLFEKEGFEMSYVVAKDQVSKKEYEKPRKTVEFKKEYPREYLEVSEKKKNFAKPYNALPTEQLLIDYFLIEATLKKTN